MVVSGVEGEREEEYNGGGRGLIKSSVYIGYILHYIRISGTTVYIVKSTIFTGEIM